MQGLKSVKYHCLIHVPLCVYTQAPPATTSVPDSVQLSDISKRVDNLRMDLNTTISRIKNGSIFADSSFTSVLSGVNFFETCETTIESNCTIQPSMPGSSPTPCITPEVLMDKVGSIK